MVFKAFSSPFHFEYFHFMANTNLVMSDIVEQLPTAKWWGDHILCLWEGFWYYPHHLEATIAARNHFQALPDDVILASSTKTGTTWLKAPIPCIMSHRGASSESLVDIDDEEDPLIKNHPNALMPSLELQIYKENPDTVLLGIPSPRLFRTNMPYQALPESVKRSGCWIICMSRNPKDIFVSLWHFMNTTRTPDQGPFPMEEAFEDFCNGVHAFGPLFDHVLGYWKESLERPEKIMFMKYEEMKEDPMGEVKRLAEFLGRPFKREEEVADVLSRCSLERLKKLEVNRHGLDPYSGFLKNAYFRSGIVGDWKNHFSDEMTKRLDEITRTKLDGSGLNFKM